VAQDTTKDAAQDKTSAGALRVYEYVTDDGIVFWSFTPIRASVVKRLVPVNVRGTHFRRHISDIHEMAFHREMLEKED